MYRNCTRQLYIQFTIILVHACIGFGDRFLWECANNTVDECYTIKSCATSTICGETKVRYCTDTRDCDCYNNSIAYFVSDY